MIVGTGRNPRFKEYYGKLNIPYLPLDLRNSSFHTLDSYQFDAAVLYAVRMPANVEKDRDEEDIAEYYRVNVIGTLDILEYCRKHHIDRLVSFGSRFDTRLYPQTEIIREDTPLNFSYTDDHAAYVLTNIAKWHVMDYYNKKYGMKNIYLRLPTIFGVGPHSGFCKDGTYKKSGLTLFMEKAAKGEEIEVYGDPDTWKDLLYVKDLAIAVRQCLESPDASGFYNIGYDRNFRLQEIVEAIVDVFSPVDRRSNIIQRTDIPNNGGFPLMDNRKIRTEVGFEPVYQDIHAMMEDYKMELDRGVYPALFGME